MTNPLSNGINSYGTNMARKGPTKWPAPINIANLNRINRWG